MNDCVNIRKLDINVFLCKNTTRIPKTMSQHARVLQRYGLSLHIAVCDGNNLEYSIKSAALRIDP